MSVGDKIGYVQVIPTMSYLTYRPVVGIECIITHVFSNAWTGILPIKVYKMFVYIYNTALMSTIATYTYNPDFFKKMTLLVNYTNFLLVRNMSGSNANISFTGIQIK